MFVHALSRQRVSKASCSMNIWNEEFKSNQIYQPAKQVLAGLVESEHFSSFTIWSSKLPSLWRHVIALHGWLSQRFSYYKDKRTIPKQFINKRCTNHLTGACRAHICICRWNAKPPVTKCKNKLLEAGPIHKCCPTIELLHY